MKCQSCNEEVPQRFNHALTTNICPYCGSSIMSDELCNTLSELKEIMGNAEQYRTEIFDWLHSNYQLISTDSEEYKALQLKAESVKVPMKQTLTAIDPKSVSLDQNGNQVSGAPIQDPATTNKFLQRAQVKNNPKDIRDIVNQIKKNGPSASTMMTMEVDPTEVTEIDNALFGGDGVGSVNGGVEQDSYYQDEDALPPVIEAMAIQASGGQAGTYNPRDVAKLQALQSKQQQARNAMRGGSVGLIRR